MLLLGKVLIKATVTTVTRSRYELGFAIGLQLPRGRIIIGEIYYLLFKLRFGGQSLTCVNF